MFMLLTYYTSYLVSLQKYYCQFMSDDLEAWIVYITSLS